MTKTFCDRCEKDCTSSYKYITYPSKDSWGGANAMLCEDCFKKFEDFVCKKS